MQRDTKFGYGFCLLGIGVPYLLDKLSGPKTALVCCALLLLVGLVFILSGHFHQRSLKRTLSMTIWFYALWGAGLGAFGGGVIGAINHLRSPAPTVTSAPDANKPEPTPRRITGDSQRESRSEREADEAHTDSPHRSRQTPVPIPTPPTPVPTSPEISAIFIQGTSPGLLVVNRSNATIKSPVAHFAMWNLSRVPALMIPT